MDYIHSLRSDISSLNLPVTLVLLCHDDAEEKIDSPTLSGMLTDIVTFDILVSPLSSGYSKDINGSISLRQNSLLPIKKALFHKVHFKILDGGIKVFAIGDS